MVAIFIVYRTQFTSNFAVLFGDRYDGIIAISIMEHWLNVLRNYSPWDTTFYFFPHHSTLGYNEAFFIHGLLHAVFRIAGLDVLLAGELGTMLLKMLGLVAFYFMLRRCFRVGPGWSLLGATIFTISNNLYLGMLHAQFAAFSLVPLMVIFVSESILAIEREHMARAIRLVAVTAVLYGSWLLTSFYTAWYFTFFGCVAASIYLATGGWRELGPLTKSFRASPLAALLFVVCLAICILPFLWLYLPKARETGMHSVEWVRGTALELIDAFNVSGENVLWGRVFGHLYHAFHGAPLANLDRSTGFPLILLLVALVATIRLLVRVPQPRTDRVLRSISLALAVTWPLAFRFGEWTPWELIYAYVPGASAIRVTARYQFFLTIPLVVLAIDYLSRLRMPRVCAGLLGLALIVEELNASPLTGLDRLRELALLDRTPLPPAGCRSFFVSRAREGNALGRDIHGLYSHNVDAMLIAEVLHLPTINGFATFTPPDWNFAYPNSPDYLDRVTAYLAHHRIEAACALDLAQRTWDLQGTSSIRP